MAFEFVPHIYFKMCSTYLLQSIINVAFHHSVNQQKSVRTPEMGHSRPNFCPKLEPIHRTIINVTFHCPVVTPNLQVCIDLWSKKGNIKTFGTDTLK